VLPDYPSTALPARVTSRIKLIRGRRAKAAELRRRYESLTSREREVMQLVVRGLLNKQIASELGASKVTIKMHRGKVMHKMKAESVVELLHMAETIAPIGAGSPIPRYTRSHLPHGVSLH
jgi:FixJ family two-component response regulator